MKNNAFVVLGILLIICGILLAVIDLSGFPLGKAIDAFQFQGIEPPQEAVQEDYITYELPVLPVFQTQDFQNGWNFVSFPEERDRTPHFQVVYELRDNAWHLVTDQRLQKNKGYFVDTQTQFLPPSTSTLDGSVLLVQGWNAFGVPANVPISQLKVVVQGALYSLLDAITRGFIRDIYSFENNQYAPIPANDENFILQAGKGYLFYAEQIGKLLFAPCNEGERTCRGNDVAVVCTAGEYVPTSCPSSQVCHPATGTCQSPFAQACSSHVGDVVSLQGKNYVLKQIGGRYFVPLSALSYQLYSSAQDAQDIIQYPSEQHMTIPLDSFSEVEGYTGNEGDEYVTTQIDRHAGILACSSRQYEPYFFLTKELSDATTFRPECSQEVDSMSFKGHTYGYSDFYGDKDGVSRRDRFPIPGSNDFGYEVYSYGEGQPTNYMVLKLKNLQTLAEVQTISVARGLPKEEGSILILPCDFFVKFFVKIG